jgi:hypothetical protein
MSWHIFRKDLKLLLRMVIGVGLINLMQRVNLSSAGLFFRASMSPQVFLSGVLEFISLLATGALIVMVVQEDPIPGLRQDWLVRPIRRIDLLLSKILFVALMVQCPILLIEVGQCLAAGFPIGPSLAAPLSRSAWMFLAMDLPVLAFATLTRSLVQAAGAALATAFGFTIFAAATTFYRYSAVQIWINLLAQLAWGLAGVGVVLALQYYRRKTTRARWMYGAAALAWLFFPFLPWKPAFAIEKRLSPQPAAANPIRIVFDPAFGKFHGQSAGVHFGAFGPTNDVGVPAPLRTIGLGEDQLLEVNEMSGRLTGPGATEIDVGNQLGSPFIGAGGSYETVWVPEEVYNRVKDQPVRIVMEYSLTLVQATPPQTIPAEGGDRWMEGVGRCATRGSAKGTYVELGCLFPGRAPCLAFSVTYPGAGQRPDRNPACGRDYAPYVDHVEGDSISRFARELPIMESQWKDAQVVLTAYHAAAHFTRQVVIPNIRLSDWRPE